MMETLRQCDKFDTCSANICPLYKLQREDGKWLQQQPSEPTCRYARAVAKNAADTIPQNIKEQVVNMYPVMMENCGSVFRIAMKQASKYPVKTGTFR